MFRKFRASSNNRNNLKYVFKSMFSMHVKQYMSETMVFLKHVVKRNTVMRHMAFSICSTLFCMTLGPGAVDATV